MKNLRCLTANCEHNVLNHCSAGIINVTENGVCASKIKREGGILSQSYADMEASTEIESLSHDDVLVQCDAKCKHNCNFSCGKDGILLEDGLMKTKCKSRKKS